MLTDHEHPPNADDPIAAFQQWKRTVDGINPPNTFIAAVERLALAYAICLCRPQSYLGTDPSDVLQKAMLKMCKARWPYDPGHGPLKAWVGTYVRSAFCDLLRKQRSRREILSPTGDMPEGADPKQMRPDQLVERSEDVARLRAALAELPPDQQAAVTARYDDGLTLKACGEALAKGTTTVHRLEQKALARLEDRLRPRDD